MILRTLLCLASLTWGTIAVAQDETPAMRDNTLINNFPGLVDVLSQDGLSFQKNDEQLSILIPTKKADFEGVLLIRWAARDGVIHFVQSLPIEVDTERLAELEEAIIRLNHALPLPGLGMNHAGPSLYFRLTVPLLPRGGLTPKDLRAYFNATLQQAYVARTILKDVNEGALPPADVLERLQDRASSSTPLPPGEYHMTLGDNQWVLTLQRDGTASLKQNGTEVVASTYKFEENLIIFEDRSGDLACEESGTYQYAHTKDGILFAPADDMCPGRIKLLTAGPWTFKGQNAE